MKRAGIIARQLIQSFLVLALLTIAMAVGSVFLVQFIDRTLSQVSARADAAALGARIRSESLTLTDMARRYTTVDVATRPLLRVQIFDQRMLLNNLLNQAYRQAIPGDREEFDRVDQIKVRLTGFVRQVDRVMNAYDSEQAYGPATQRELTVLIRDYQDPLVTALRDFESLESERVQTARSQARRVIQAVLIALVLVAAVVFIAATLTIRRILGRIVTSLALLRAGVDEFRHGCLDQPVQVSGADEIGELATAFNTMAAELQQSQIQLADYARTLEQRVAERTEELAHRAMQLQIGSQVAQQITAILAMDELLARIVSSIQSQFGYYFVSIWLASDKRDYLALQAGSGYVVEKLAEQGMRIPMDAASIIAGVCRSGRPRRVDDVTQAPDYLAVEALAEARSELALPLRVGQESIGVLDILGDQPAVFKPEDEIVLQMLADQIAIAIRNAQSYRAEQSRRHLAESLERAGRELSSDLDVREVAERILQQLAAVVPYERGSVMVQYGEVMRIVAQRGFPEDERIKELLVPIRKGDVFQQVAAAGKPVLVDDVTQAEGWRQIEWLPVNLSWMGVPLVAKSKAVGMLSLTRREAAAFQVEDATLAAAFAGQAAVALENARLYGELNTAYQTLERLDKTKSDFIDVAAHELRTPLTVIKGYTQVLAAMPLLAKDQQASQLLEGVVAGATRLQEIVNSMLDVTKIDSQTLRMRCERIGLANIIERVHTEFESALRERRLTLTVTGIDDLPLIEADPALLFKVFYHLVVNAIKYTPDGGAITVSGTFVPCEKYEMGQDAIEVVVSDTGIGIDPAHHELIFEKFYQTGEVAVHSSGRTKFKGGGPGLGLAIVKGIVLAHGGRVWVESEGYDEVRCPGSRFFVRLPLKR